MYTLLDDTKTMEHKYKLSDPKALEADTDYPTIEPLALLGTIQREYVILLKNKTWPGISTKLPEGNNTGTDKKKVPKGTNPTDNDYNQGCGRGKGGRGGGSRRGRGRGGCGHANGRRAGRNISCFNCRENHFAHACTHRQTESDTNGGAAPTDQTQCPQRKPLAAWKYVCLANLRKVITDDTG